MSMTINPESIVDEQSLTVTRTIRIAAPRDKVWAAVTEPEHVSRWFGRLQLDGRGAGAAGIISFEGYGDVPIRVESIDAPRSVTYRWGNDDAAAARPASLDDSTSTVFTFTLEVVDGGTELTVVEQGFEVTSDPAYNLAEHGKGWNDELDKLVALVEGETA